MKLDPKVTSSAKKVNNIKWNDTQLEAGITTGVTSADFTQISKNLDVLRDSLKVGTVRLLAVNLIKILSSAQPRVPIETGRLRESGQARIMLGGREGIVVAQGNKSGSVSARLDKITYSRVKSAKKKIDAIIEYQRVSDDDRNFDVALWTHEDLNPHGSMSPAAKTPYTGPKYLESAWKEHKGDFINSMNNFLSDSSVSNLVTQLSKKTGTKGRYTVNKVILARDRLQRVGFYN